MKKSILSIAVAAIMVGAGPASAVSVPINPGQIVFTDGAPTVAPGTFTLAPGSYFAGVFYPVGLPPAVIDAQLNTQFGLNAAGEPGEFRMRNSGFESAGGGDKSLVGIRDDGTTPDNGSTTSMTWQVGDHPTAPLNGIVLATDGDLTPGADNSAIGQVTGAMSNAIFFEQTFGFGGSVPFFVEVDYDTNTLTIDAASIEAQWGNQFFPMGDAAGGANECNTDGQGCGIHFFGNIFNVAGDGSFDFHLFGEHRVTPYEDTEGGTVGAAAFAGFVAQFALQGSYTAASTPPEVPVPAAVWLFGSGLLGLVGVARRKKT